MLSSECSVEPDRAHSGTAWVLSTLLEGSKGRDYTNPLGTIPELHRPCQRGCCVFAEYTRHPLMCTSFYHRNTGLCTDFIILGDFAAASWEKCLSELQMLHLKRKGLTCLHLMQTSVSWLTAPSRKPKTPLQRERGVACTKRIGYQQCALWEEQQAWYVSETE